MLFVLSKMLSSCVIDLVYSDKSLPVCIDPLFSCSRSHQDDLKLFIITAEARLSLSMVCCISDTPLCDKGNVTAVHQAICLFGEVNSLLFFPLIHFHTSMSAFFYFFVLDLKVAVCVLNT